MKIGRYYAFEDGQVFKCISRYYDPDDSQMFSLVRDICCGECYWVKESWFMSNVIKEYD